MDLNEAQTRAQRIDAQLAVAGWGNSAQQTNFEVELKVAGFGTATAGFVDYSLPAADGTPLAIVEAKRASRDPIVAKEQARIYADTIQAATGSRPFVYLANGDEIWFWDSGTEPRLVSGFSTREDLERKRFQRDNRTSLLGQYIDAAIVDRTYQQEAIRKVHEAFETDAKRRALLVMATGTGKTRTATALVDTLLPGARNQLVQRHSAEPCHLTCSSHVNGRSRRNRAPGIPVSRLSRMRSSKAQQASPLALVGDAG